MSRLQTSNSFRSISKSFQIFIFSFLLQLRSPCSNTIQLWVLKIGLHELSRLKEEASDWIIILDFSIQLGQDRILLIYGIRERELKNKNALKCSDMKILRLLCRTSWKREDVKEVLNELKSELNTIIYAVSDNGSELKGGLKMSEIKQVYDLTHALAGITEEIFKNDETYIAITKEMANMKVKLNQTDAAHLVSLKQRKKSHYQNIKKISEYLLKFLNYVEAEKYKEKLNEREEQFVWIKKYNTFINNFYELNEVISKIEAILKKEPWLFLYLKTWENFFLFHLLS